MTNSTHYCKSTAVAIIHASAVLTDGGTFVFLGPSGSGKSTVCNFLSAHTHTQFLANEAVYLTSGTDEKWYAANADDQAYRGSPPKDPDVVPEAAPLRAIFRLFQAPASRVEWIDAAKTCGYLTDALFEIAWQREYDIATKKALFSDLAEVCRSVPGYEFYFDLSPQTLQVLWEKTST